MRAPQWERGTAEPSYLRNALPGLRDSAGNCATHLITDLRQPQHPKRYTTTGLHGPAAARAHKTRLSGLNWVTGQPGASAVSGSRGPDSTEALAFQAAPPPCTPELSLQLLSAPGVEWQWWRGRWNTRPKYGTAGRRAGKERAGRGRAKERKRGEGRGGCKTGREEGYQ